VTFFVDREAVRADIRRENEFEFPSDGLLRDCWCVAAKERRTARTAKLYNGLSFHHQHGKAYRPTVDLTQRTIYAKLLSVPHFTVQFPYFTIDFQFFAMCSAVRQATA
jgi:hypothetical protein